MKETAPARIEVRLRRLVQLFNSLDPSPFNERDLDRDAEAFLVSWAKDLGPECGYEIVIHLSEPVAEDREKAVEGAVQHFFAERAGDKEREFRALMRQGRTSLVVGLVFLTACLTLIGLATQVHYGPAAQVIHESLAIGGWVAMWRPLQIYLYDWWPLREERRVLEQLGKARVRIAMPEESDPAEF